MWKGVAPVTSESVILPSRRTKVLGSSELTNTEDTIPVTVSPVTVYWHVICVSVVNKVSVVDNVNPPIDNKVNPVKGFVIPLSVVSPYDLLIVSVVSVNASVTSLVKNVG